MTAVADTDARATWPDGVRLGLLGVLALVVAVVRNGIWGTPNLPFFAAIARNWGSNPFPRGLDGDYLLTNLLGPTVAKVLGQTAPHAYARLHLTVLVAGLVAVVALAYRRLGYRPAVALVWILAASPALTVCLEWLGQPDVWTFCLALALPLCRRRWSGFAVAVLLGLSHPEQGLIIALVAAVATALLSICGSNVPSDVTFRTQIAKAGATFVAGVLAGRGLTQIYLWANDITVSRPRTSYLCLGLRGFLDHHLSAPVPLLYSLWGPLWLAIAALTWRWWRTRSGPWPWVLLTAALALGPVAVTLDETRVYALTTAPLLVVMASLLAQWSDLVPDARTNRWSTRLVANLAVVALMALPGMFSAGAAYWAPALRPTEFARFLVDGSVPGGADRTATWLLSPFGFRVPPTC